MRLDRGALVILVFVALMAWSIHAAVVRDVEREPWRLSALDERTEAQPALSGVVEDRRGRVLARPIFESGRWMISRPFGRPLANAGLGRTLVQPHGIQGNLAGLMRTGASGLRPYEAGDASLPMWLGSPILTAPSMPVVRTTLDVDLSVAIYELLAQQGKKASVVVMSARTAELHAVVDFPGPDVYSDVEPNLRVSLDAMNGANLPASTMKVLSAAYVLERRPGDAQHAHECTGDRCWMRHGRVQNLQDAIVRSCNTWFRLESAAWNRAEWLQFVVESGLQPPDTVGLPTAPVVFAGPNGSRMHWPHAVGQQVWVSMVGLASAYATLTSPDGRRVNPRVILGPAPDADRPQIVRTAVAERLREILWANGRFGTARGVNETYLAADAGGKTGTGERDGEVSEAVFVAVAPWDRPEWVAVVLVDQGASGSAIGSVAGGVLNLLARKRLVRLPSLGGSIGGSAK